MTNPNSFWQKIDAHLNNVAFYQTVFSLPFAYMAAFLAADGKPDIWVMFWITLTIVAARSAALALDNLIDLKYDVDQPRFKGRPMVAGSINKKDVYILIVLCFAVLIGSVLQLDPICIKLLPVAALPFIIYPYMKRITCFCHYVCGVAVAMAPAGGWVAVTGEISWPMIVLCVAVALWIGGFDVVYGAQDEDFDKAHGLHSMATALGAKGALLLAKITHIVTLAVFIYLGILFNLGFMYYIGVLVSAFVLYYQHRIIHIRGFGAFTREYYMRNGIVSVAIFLFTLASVYMK
ncbi:4-hydroxybenzoate octaprenyltransferase [Anaerovibrio sp.]|uniref:4-hydroxybenzoate octaprenyltransferase n=1 Tax=Anaerovibrio sp. TaxID=1872532 RepID=UPI0025C18AED|nr:4-hydroxybenzoate octaprenyltransferase [Anaerovibrio sp.]